MSARADHRAGADHAGRDGSTGSARLIVRPRRLRIIDDQRRHNVSGQVGDVGSVHHVHVDLDEGTAVQASIANDGERAVPTPGDSVKVWGPAEAVRMLSA